MLRVLEQGPVGCPSLFVNRVFERTNCSGRSRGRSSLYHANDTIMALAWSMVTHRLASRGFVINQCNETF